MACKNMGSSLRTIGNDRVSWFDAITGACAFTLIFGWALGLFLASWSDFVACVACAIAVPVEVCVGPCSAAVEVDFV